MSVRVDATVKVEGTKDFLRRFRAASPKFLDALQPVVADHANKVMAVANIAVPKDDGELANSAFVDGPTRVETAEKKSVSATCGYDADHAPYVHEGFHYGRKTSTPPKWLEFSAWGIGKAFRSTCRSVLRAVLKTI